jgi:hypothetical protein
MVDHIKILSESPIEQIWIHLSQYESKALARKLLQDRATAAGVQISAELLDAKALGVAYCLRNAREYLVPTPTEWTKRILVSYYGLMSFVSAILVADPANAYTLDALEARTKQGHGINNVVDERQPFPAAELLYLTGSGFMAAYLSAVGVELNQFTLTRNQVSDLSSLAPQEAAKLLSLDGLLARIPEVADLYGEVTGCPSLTAHCFHSSRNHEEQLAALRGGTGEGAVHHTWVGARNTRLLTPEAFSTLEIPLQDVVEAEDLLSDDRFFEGKLVGAVGGEWWDVLNLYKSAMCGSSWVKPAFGTRDMIAIHLMLLYALSIVVRYRPKRWREITEGELDSFFALIKAYLAVFNRVVPELALARITGRSVRADHPDGLSGLV